MDAFVAQPRRALAMPYSIQSSSSIAWASLFTTRVALQSKTDLKAALATSQMKLDFVRDIFGNDSMQTAAAYNDDGEPIRTAAPGEWYRVVRREDAWALAVLENDTPENAVWLIVDERVRLSLE